MGGAKEHIMKHCFVINPAAGKGRVQGALEDSVIRACEAAGEEYSVYYTKSKADCEQYVRARCAEGEPIRIYACGGDGTLCDVINGAAGFENAEVGLVPIGTGNDFVRNFTLKEKFMDIAAQLRGHICPIDLIKYNGRYLINMLNTGFDCEVVRQAARIKTHPWVPGALAYILGVVKVLISKPGVRMRVSVDGGEPQEKSLLLTCVGNGEFCGGGFRSEPYASPSDGLMDVSFVNDLTRRKFLAILSYYKNGKYLSRADADELAEYVRCSRLNIEFPAPQAVSIDGEIEELERIELRVERGALRFCMPEGCAQLEPMTAGAVPEAAAV